MTAENEVGSEVVSEISKVEIEEEEEEEKCVLDLPPKDGGAFKHVDDDDDDEGQEEEENMNGYVKKGKDDDPDGSYVFVSRRNDDLLLVGGNNDLKNGGAGATNPVLPQSNKIISSSSSSLDKDVEVQFGDLTHQNGTNVQLGLEEEDNCCIVDVPTATEEGKTDCPEIDLEVARSTNAVEEQSETVKPLPVDDGEVNTVEQPIHLEESTVLLLAATGDSVSPELNVGNVVSDQPNNLKPTAEFGDDLVEESQIVVPESFPANDGIANTEDKSQLQPTTQFGNSDESQHLILEASLCESSMVNNVSANSGEQGILDSNEELKESHEYQIVAADAAGGLLPEVGVENVKSEDQTESRTAREVKVAQDSQTTITESTSSESSELDSGEEKLDKEKKTDFGSEKENPGSENMVSDVVDGGLDQVEEPTRLADDTNIPLETEVANDLVSRLCKENSPTSEIGESIPPTSVLNKSIAEIQITVKESTESESCELDSVEAKLEEENTTEFDMEKENLGSENVVSDVVDSGLDQGKEPARLASDTNILLETEVANDLVSGENNDKLLTSHVEDSTLQNEVPKKSTDGIQKSPHGNGYPENVKSSPSSTSCMKLEVELGNAQSGEILPTGATDNMRPEAEFEKSNINGRESVLAYPPDEAKFETEVENVPFGCDKMSCPANRVGLETEISPGSVDPEEEVPITPFDDLNIDSEVLNGATECACINPMSVSSIHEVGPEYHVYDTYQNGSCPDAELESDDGNSSVTNSRDVADSDAAICRSEMLNVSIVSSESGVNGVSEAVHIEKVEEQFNGGEGEATNKLSCQETEVTGGIHRDGISTSSPESCTADALEGQNLVDAGKRPLLCLIRIPRYDDDKLREQIRLTQLQVDEKTKCRDAIRVEIQRKRANCQDCLDEFEAAKSEVRAAKGKVRSKHQEKDSVQAVITRVKNAISIGDIDGKIHRMEHMMVHETLPLKEEKQFIREIKQMKHIREQLSSNMGSRDEVQQAMDQKDHTEERLKIVQRELDCLRDKVSKAEATAEAAGKKYKDENEKLKELQAQFRAADDIRQKEYAHLQSLRRQLYEKNKHFRMYKDEAVAANGCALSGDREAVHRICINQMEKIMELWNKDEDFRKEYVRCNTRSTLRRLRTLDGRSLGPDEGLPMPPNAAHERVDKSLLNPGKANSIPMISTLEPVKKCPPVEGEVDGKPMTMLVELKNQTAKTSTKTVVPIMVNGTATVSSNSVVVPEEEESKLTKEEKELARKAEELRKEEAEAKLREQSRLEEKAKAREALERKKRIAEKAQIRAELRSQKEAEQKEKEMEKRARKKERKKTATTAVAPNGNGNDEEGESDPTPIDHTNKEPEIREGTKAVTKGSQKPWQLTKQSKKKSIPPPLLRKRGGKRRMQPWMWVILASLFLLVLALFLLGTSSSFSLNLGLPSFGF